MKGKRIWREAKLFCDLTCRQTVRSRLDKESVDIKAIILRKSGQCSDGA